MSLGADVSLKWRQRWAFVDDTGTLTAIRPLYCLGVRASFTAIPNGIAGHLVGLAGFLQQPVWLHDNHQLALEVDYGMSLFTNPYSRSHNTDNIFIGSYINCLIHVGLVYEHAMADGSSWLVGGKLVHCSNGYLQKPNMGLNFLQLECAYTLPDPQRRQLPGADTWLLDDAGGHLLRSRDTSWNSAANDLLLSYAPGFVLPRYENRRHYYYAHTARVGWLHQFNARHTAGVNVDMTYNYSYDAINRANHIDYPLPFFIGLCGNYEATWHRFFIHMGVAAYLARSPKNNTEIYERVGLFYYLGNKDRWDTHRFRHFIGMSLKSHAAHIDFIEWHYGIKFRMRR